MLSNYGATDIIAWTSPLDVAAAIAEEIETRVAGRKIRYVASEVLSYNEVAAILGAAIGQPDLKWLVVPDEQMQSLFEKVGMNPHIAASLIEMNRCMHSGELFEEYYLHPPTLGEMKLKDFAKDFAAAFLA
ncbi:MAG: azoB 1 [Chitinophagaceae bacterium]|nr:azoB 1 [Chitinophagaceae bacterium]